MHTYASVPHCGAKRVRGTVSPLPVDHPFPPFPLPLRDVLVNALRRVVVAGAGRDDFPETVRQSLLGAFAPPPDEASPDTGIDAPLRAFVEADSFLPHVREWLREMPKTRRAEWIADHLVSALGSDWAQPAVDAPGELLLPEAMRADLHARLEAAAQPPRPLHDTPTPRPVRASIATTATRTYAQLERVVATESRKVLVEPTPERYAEALDAGLRHWGEKYPALAVRIAVRRIVDTDGGGGARPFTEALAHRRIAAPDRILKFLERALEIRFRGE